MLMNLKTVWTDNLNSGIFHQLSFLDVPWSDANTKQYDFYYYNQHSGRKCISDLVESQLTDDDTLTSESKMLLAETAYALYSDKWKKVWLALHADYNPISNYDMTETEQSTSNNAGGSTDTLAETASNTTTDSSTDNTTSESSNTSSSSGSSLSKAFVFNSDDAEDRDKAESNDEASASGDASSSREYESERSDNSSRNSTNTNTHTDDTTTNRTLKRSGNIGVTTAQQMIESEIVLREKNFMLSVMSDLDNILTLDFYI